MHPDPSAPVRPLGRFERWRLAEPVRLYGYGALCLALATLGLASWVAGAWFYFGAPAPAMLFMVVGIECARASVYSPRGAMAERVDAALRARLNR